MRVVLVSGSREPGEHNHAVVAAALDEITGDCRTLVIHGAALGVDWFAGFWCAENEVSAHDVPAEWNLHGKAAGAIRNALMVELLGVYKRNGHDCHVLAFPRGKSPGTRDLIRKATAAGFEPVVTELEE